MCSQEQVWDCHLKGPHAVWKWVSIGDVSVVLCSINFFISIFCIAWGFLDIAFDWIKLFLLHFLSPFATPHHSYHRPSTSFSPTLHHPQHFHRPAQQTWQTSRNASVWQGGFHALGSSRVRWQQPHPRLQSWLVHARYYSCLFGGFF